MNSKKKFKRIKIFMVISIILYIFALSSLFVLFGVDKLWGDMFTSGSANTAQLLTLILYRVLLYVPLPLLFAIIKFDKRYKYSSRAIIWYNWMFFILLIIYAIYDIFALSLVTKIKIFNTMSSFILLLGYLFSYIKKEKVSFDETETIIKQK